MTLERRKLLLDTLQAAVTILAILVGGGWTAWLFIFQREISAHAVVEVKSHIVPLTSAVNLIQVELKFHNTGNRLIPISSTTVRVEGVLPLAGCAPKGDCATKELNAALVNVDRAADKFDWPIIASRIGHTANAVEPDETTNLEFEFAIPASVTVARIHGFIENSAAPKVDGLPVGWLDSEFITIPEARKAAEPAT